MTPAEFRRLALGMQNVIEGAHMGHPDFRVNGRIFATLSADGRQGMVKLTPAEQRPFMRDHPAAFTPASGGWGRQGCTMVRLDAADADLVGEAMTIAWEQAVRRPTPAASRRARRAPPRRSTTR